MAGVHPISLDAAKLLSLNNRRAKSGLGLDPLTSLPGASTSASQTNATGSADVASAAANISAANAEENKNKKNISRASNYLGQGTSSALGMSVSNKTLLGS